MKKIIFIALLFWGCGNNSTAPDPTCDGSDNKGNYTCVSEIFIYLTVPSTYPNTQYTIGIGSCSDDNGLIGDWSCTSCKTIKYYPENEIICTESSASLGGLSSWYNLTGSGIENINFSSFNDSSSDHCCIPESD